MIVIELISKQDCLLCDKAKAVLLKVQKLHSFELKEIKIKEGDEYFERYKEQIPVMLINDEIIFRYKVSELALINKLKQYSV